MILTEAENLPNRIGWNVPVPRAGDPHMGITTATAKVDELLTWLGSHDAPNALALRVVFRELLNQRKS